MTSTSRVLRAVAPSRPLALTFILLSVHADGGAGFCQ